MKDSVKANLIIFFIIAVASFCISTAFAGLTVTEETDSYKLIPIDNDSFEPNYINKVPTILPKVENNYTNNTTVNTTDLEIDDIEDSIDYENDTYEETYEDE